MEWMDQLWVVAATAYAMVLGGVIGFERELKNRPAGFRTHMLVGGAAALLLGIGELVLTSDGGSHTSRVQIDPLRLVEAVIAGVSFIGAGTIFAGGRGQSVAGITTAASLLMVAVIGVATGMGYYALATAATAMTLLILTALNVVERRLASRNADREER